MQKIKVAKIFFSCIKLSYAMLQSLSKRIYIPLTTSYHHHHHFNPFYSPGHPRQRGNHLRLPPPRPEPKWSPQPERQHSSTEAQGDMSIDKNSPMASQEGPSSSKRGKTADWSSSLKPSHADAFSRTPVL